MFLRECLDSLIEQTIQPSKIIIANDNSTDDTHAIATEYMEKHPDLFLIRTTDERVGTIQNENGASDLVGTPWMFFLDADDKLDKRYIEKVLEVIERSDDKLMVVYSDMQKFGNWDGVWVTSDWDPVSLRTGNYINGHSVFRTDIFREIGKLRDTGGFEDHQMWVDMLDLNRNLYGVRIPEALVWYRRHNYGHRTDGSDVGIRGNM